MLDSKEPKVSVVVAFYKSEPFIKKCIESIINQTYKNIEIILVDDGSPDNCGKICDDYAKKDKRIIVLHEENSGACQARNNGVKIASGDYLSIIDGDDWLSPDYIEYLLNLIIVTDSDMAMTDNIFTTRDQKQIDNDELITLSPKDALIKIIYPIIPIGPWNKLYKSKFLKDKKITFDIPWSGEGLYYSAMAAQYSKKVGLGHRKVYNYRLNNSGSGLTNYNVMMGINALSNIKLIKSKCIFHDKEVDGAFSWHIWKNHNFLLKLIIATNSSKKYKKEYDECINYIKNNFLNTLRTSKVGVKGKLVIISQYFFPVLYAKRCIMKERKNLKKDTMK